jgi:hypothetical protein
MLRNGEFQNLYSSPSILRMLKSRTMGWAEAVARIVGMRNTYIDGKSTRKETTRKTKT